MQPIFCFIDDSEFELDVFRENIVPASPGVRFILGYEYAEVRAELGDEHPCLFLLDLYGRDPNVRGGRIPTREELISEAARMSGMESIYEGLDDVQGDRINEFLKRLYHVTNPWRDFFYRMSRLTGQNTNFGRGNLASVRQDYPAASAVAYTRKSVIKDAVDILDAGAEGVFLKPDAPDDASIRKATARTAPSLLSSWGHLVTARFTGRLERLALGLALEDRKTDALDLLRPAGLTLDLIEARGLPERSFLAAAAAWWRHLELPPLA